MKYVIKSYKRFLAINRKEGRIKRCEVVPTNKRTKRLGDMFYRTHDQTFIGKYICDITCECGETHTVTFKGWNVIGCGACGAQMYRHEAIPEIDSYYRLFAAGACDKWHAFGHIFKYVDGRQVTLKRAAEIGEEYGIPQSQTYNMRQRFLGMRTPQQKEA